MPARCTFLTALTASTAAVLVIAAGPAGATSTPLPTLGAGDGVSVRATAMGMEVRMAGAAAQAAARYAGRRLSVQCRTQPGTGLRFTDTASTSSDGEAKVARAADGTLVLATTIDGGAWDTCEVARPYVVPRTVGRDGPFAVVEHAMRPPLARVALTAGGVAWIDELDRAVAMNAAVERVRAVRPSMVISPAEATAAGLVPLPGEGASPPAGAIGYWTDGARKTEVVAVSATGRRLVDEALDPLTRRTNLDRLDGDVAAARGTGGVLFDLRGVDRDPTPSPLRAEAGDALGRPPEVRAALAGTRLALRFEGRTALRRLRRLAGRRVSVSCGPSDPPVALGSAAQFAALFQRVEARVPRRGAVLHATLRAGRPADVCLVSDDGHAVAIALPTPGGRALFEDLAALGRVYAVVYGPMAPDGATRYPPAAAIAAKSHGRVVALPTPGAALKPGGPAGVWTDGPRAVVAARSASGRRIEIADEGDGVVRDDTGWLVLVSLPFTF